MRLPELFSRPSNVFGVLFVVNFLNYVDRGIIPGANDEFIRYISFNLDTSDPDVFLGLLQSSFIVGFSLASLVFGHLVHFYGPFTLISFGLSLWLVATALCGIGFQHNSFSLLLFARMLSGVGEASFSCSVPPWITKYGTAGRKATWLALYYTAIPVGMAFGYPYAALIGGAIGCEWVFFLESFAMLPCIIFIAAISHAYPCEFQHRHANEHEEHREAASCTSSIYLRVEGGNSSSNRDIDSSLKKPLLDLEQEGEQEEHTQDAEANDLQLNSATSQLGTVKQTKKDRGTEAPTVLDELRAVMGCPIYLCFVAGSAAQAAVMVGLGTFGSAFLMGLGYFDSETAASSMFGLLVSIAGIVGTPLGGLLVDSSGSSDDDNGSSSNNRGEASSSSSSAISLSVDTALLGLLQNNDSRDSRGANDTPGGNGRAKTGVVLGDEEEHRLAAGKHVPTDAAATAADAIYSPVHSNPVIDDDVTSSAAQRINEESSSLEEGEEENVLLSSNKLSTIRLTSRLVAGSSALGTLSLILVYFVHSEVLFLLLMTFGCMFIFLCNPGINIGVMSSVPEGNKSFAIALMSIFIHAFGDVPSPIITGLLKDLFAPGCSPSSNTGTPTQLGTTRGSMLLDYYYSTIHPYLSATGTNIAAAAAAGGAGVSGVLGSGSSASISKQCRSEAHGLRLTMLCVSLWLCVSVLFFSLVWHLTNTSKNIRSSNKRKSGAK